jgi:hypothetical protein
MPEFEQGGVADAFFGGSGDSIADGANSEWVSQDPGSGWEQAPSVPADDSSSFEKAYNDAGTAVTSAGYALAYGAASMVEGVLGNDTEATAYGAISTGYENTAEAFAGQAIKDAGLDQVDVTAAAEGPLGDTSW